MNRRDFLAGLAGAAAWATLPRVASAAGASPYPLAVNLGMVKAGATTLEKMQLIRDAGFTGVELNRPDAIPLDEIQAALKATGLKVANVICSTHWGKPITSHDPAVREQGMRGLRLALQETGELGCEHLLLVPGVVNKDVSYEEAYQRSQESIRAAIPDAEKAKVKIAIENVWNKFLLSPLEARQFVDELKSPWVGFHFDIGNVITYGYPEQWIRILGKRTLTLHIKEFSVKLAESTGHRKGFDAEIGEGDVNWAAVRTALKETGYQGWAVLEVKGGDGARLKELYDRATKALVG